MAIEYDSKNSNGSASNGANSEAVFDSLLNRVNLHHLYYFWVVAKLGSIRQASERLMLAPPTVSRQIRELESKLQVQLLARSNQNVTLTVQGEQVRILCDELFGLARQLVDGIWSEPTSRTLRLTVGVAGVIPKLVVYKVLEPALHLHDRVQIVCFEGAPAKLISELTNHTLDMILADSPIGPYANVRSFCHLIAESPVMVCGNALLAHQYREGFPASLNGAPVLLPTSNSALRASLDNYFFESNIIPDIRGEFEDSAVIKVFGEAGLGLFFVPATIAAEVQLKYRCEIVGQLDGVLSRYYAIVPHRRISNPATIAVLESAAI